MNEKLYRILNVNMAGNTAINNINKPVKESKVFNILNKYSTPENKITLDDYGNILQEREKFSLAKTVATGGYLVDKAAISAMDTMENVFVDMPAYLGAGANKLLYSGLGGLAGLFGLDDVQKQMQNEGNKSSKAMMKIGQKNIVRDIAQEEKLDQLASQHTHITYPNNSMAVDIAQGVGQIGGQVLTGNALGGLGMASIAPFSNASKAGRYANRAINMLPTAGANAFSSGTNKAYDENSNNISQALAYGGMTGAKESSIEAAFAGLGGTKSEKIVSNLLENKNIGGKVSKKIGGYIGDKVVDALGEGMEEGVSELLDPLLRKSTYYKDSDLIEEYKEVPKNAARAFGSSFLSTLLFNVGKDGIEISTNKHNANKVENRMDTKDTINNFSDGTQYELSKPDKTVEVNKVDNLVTRLSTVAKEGLIKNINEYKDKHIMPKIENEIERSVKGNKQEEKANIINSLLNTKDGSISNVEIESIIENINKKVENPDFQIELEYIQEKPNVNGYYDQSNNIIYLNTNTKDTSKYTTTLKHELTHWLEKSESYTNFEDAVITEFQKTGELDQIRKQMKKTYEKQLKQKVDNDYIDKEITAKYVESLFTNQEFIEKIAVQNENMFKKAKMWIDEKINDYQKSKNITAEQKQEFTYMRRMQKIYINVMNDLQKGNLDFNVAYNKKHNYHIADSDKMVNDTDVGSIVDNSGTNSGSMKYQIKTKQNGTDFVKLDTNDKVSKVDTEKLR